MNNNSWVSSGSEGISWEISHQILNFIARKILVVSIINISLNKWRKYNSERLSHVPNILQTLSGRSGIGSHSSSLTYMPSWTETAQEFLSPHSRNWDMRAKVSGSWVFLFSRLVRLWLTSFFWRWAFGIFQTCSFFHPPARIRREFFSDIYYGNLVELLEVNLMIWWRLLYNWIPEIFNSPSGSH